MVEKTATVKNSQGIHCRPSAEIVKAIKDYKGEMWVVSAASEGDPRSIMSILSLGLACGHEVTVRVTGEGDVEMCEKLVELFSREYDFPPKTEEVSAADVEPGT